ncbi:unnamed protein product [Cercospora beticola]|nr:unnamed protein product [Cercospora beticola]
MNLFFSFAYWTPTQQGHRPSLQTSLLLTLVTCDHSAVEKRSEQHGRTHKPSAADLAGFATRISLEVLQLELKLWDTQRERDFKIITAEGEVIEVHKEVVCRACPRLADFIQNPDSAPSLGERRGEGVLAIWLPTDVLWELVAYLYGFEFSYEFCGPEDTIENVNDFFVAAKQFELPGFWAQAESAVCAVVRMYVPVDCFILGVYLFGNSDFDAVPTSVIDLLVRLTAPDLDRIKHEDWAWIVRYCSRHFVAAAEEFGAHVSNYAAAQSLVSGIEQIHIV